MDLFEQEKIQSNDALLLGLFEAYRDARKNKRAKRTQVAFEFDHEKKLMRLHKSIVNRRYKPLQSTAFISTKPVIREVFATHFQDRYVKYVERRCKTSFYVLVEQINAELKENIPNDETLHFMRSRVNSYLGTLMHFASFKLRKRVLAGLDDAFYHYFMLDKDFSRVVLKQYY